MKSKIKIFILIIVILAILLSLNGCNGLEKKVNLNKGVWSYTQNYLREEYDSSTVIVFPSYSKEFISKIDENNFQIDSYFFVSEECGCGKYEKIKFNCLIEYRGRKFLMISMDSAK